MWRKHAIRQQNSHEFGAHPAPNLQAPRANQNSKHASACPACFNKILRGLRRTRATFCNRRCAFCDENAQFDSKIRASSVHIRRQICKRRARNKIQSALHVDRKVFITCAARAQIFAAVGARFAAKTRSSTPKIARVWRTFRAKIASAARKIKCNSRASSAEKFA